MKIVLVLPAMYFLSGFGPDIPAACSPAIVGHPAPRIVGWESIPVPRDTTVGQPVEAGGQIPLTLDLPDE